MQEIYLTIIILLVILLIKLIILDNHEKGKENKISKTENTISIILTIISIIVFFISLYCNRTTGELLEVIIKSLPIPLIILPVNFSFLYRIPYYSYNMEKCNTKTVVTNLDNNKEYVEELNNSGVNVILINNNKNNSYGFKTLKLEEINSSSIKTSFHYRSKDIYALDDYLDSETTIYEQDSIMNAFESIIDGRIFYEQYVEMIKYIISMNLPLLLSYTVLTIIGFPFSCNLVLIALLKLLTFVTNTLLISTKQVDATEAAKRHPKDKNLYIPSQELIFGIIQGLVNFFVMTIPYMLVISENGNTELAFRLYLHVYLFANLFEAISLSSNYFIVVTQFKEVIPMKYRYIPAIVITIFITLILNYLNIFTTINIGVKNYISCACFGLATIFLNELIKFARYRASKKKRG